MALPRLASDYASDKLISVLLLLHICSGPRLPRKYPSRAAHLGREDLIFLHIDLDSGSGGTRTSDLALIRRVL